MATMTRTAVDRTMRKTAARRTAARRIALLVTLRVGLATLSVGVGAGSLCAAAENPRSPSARPPIPRLEIDRSGAKRVGIASFYAKKYFGRRMADGTRMRPDGNNAASLTLPLGTTARVTNLETGRSSIVVIRDRGPYVWGRIVDLSPATARAIGLDARQGLARVEVAPIAMSFRSAPTLARDVGARANEANAPMR